MGFSVNPILKKFIEKYTIVIKIKMDYLEINEADKYVKDKLKECLEYRDKKYKLNSSIYFVNQDNNYDKLDIFHNIEYRPDSEYNPFGIDEYLKANSKMYKDFKEKEKNDPHFYEFNENMNEEFLHSKKCDFILKLNGLTEFKVSEANLDGKILEFDLKELKYQC